MITTYTLFVFTLTGFAVGAIFGMIGVNWCQNHHQKQIDELKRLVMKVEHL